MADISGMTIPRQVVPGRDYRITRRCSERRFFVRLVEANNILDKMTYAFTNPSAAAKQSGR